MLVRDAFYFTPITTSLFNAVLLANMLTAACGECHKILILPLTFIITVPVLVAKFRLTNLIITKWVFL